MSHSELNQLTRAEQLFDDSKLDEALEILSDWNQFEGLDLQQKGYFQFLKGLILIYQNKYEELIELGEQIFKEGQKFNENLQSLDGLYFIIFGLGLANKFDKALKKIGKVEALMRLFTNVSENILIQREARISVLKAWINLRIVKPDLAEECIEWIFNSQQELGNTFEIVWANLIMTEIMVRIKSRYNLAMEYTKKALLVAKEIKFNHFWIGYCYLSFGVIYSSIGEFNISLKYYMKCLKIFKEINNSWYFAMVLNNIGSSYAESGDYDLALKYLEESLELYEQLPETIFNIESPLDGLISVSLEKGDIERAQKYFHRLENIYFQKRDSNVELVYQYNKALMLKRSTRIRDKAKAEELLKHIIETESLFFDLIIKAHIHLCDLLLAEFQVNNNYEVFEEINNYIAKLLTIA
ncbi:MAG: tetratricopeptide repeat protein, partial [Promethearchaeota archaeon]